MFFSLSSWQLGLFVFAVVMSASALGVFAGRFLRASSERIASRSVSSKVRSWESSASFSPSASRLPSAGTRIAERMS